MKLSTKLVLIFAVMAGLMGVSNKKLLAFIKSAEMTASDEPNKKVKPIITEEASEGNVSLPCGKDGLINGTGVCAPRIIIGGAMKCGTNEMMRLLALHPRVKFNLCDPSKDKMGCNPKKYQGGAYDGKEEIWEFPTRGFANDDLSEFVQRFPDVDGSTNITADKSAGLFLKVSPSKLRSVIPNTKFVMTVCDPAERIVSHYYHLSRDETVRENSKRRFAKKAPNVGLPPTFDDFVQTMDGTSDACTANEKSCESLREQFTQHGYYYEAIKKWNQYYPKESFLVLNMELSSNEKVRRLLEFAGLPLEEYPWGAEDGERKYVNNGNLSKYSGRSQEWNKYPKFMNHMSGLYKESNAKLSELIGEDFPIHWGQQPSM